MLATACRQIGARFQVEESAVSQTEAQSLREVQQSCGV